MYNHNSHRDDGTAVLAFALGLAAGIVGTVIFAALDEDKFGRAVKKTRSVGDRAEGYARDLGARASSTADDITEAAKGQYEAVGAKAKRQINRLKGHVDQLADEANSHL